ncbi:MAG TPA: PAS domain S-box protein, partial [Thermoanaerobaculia bacterium]|nr:PAS domain S-box protein [Thermoanaerobaculia bacterium]
MATDPLLLADDSTHPARPAGGPLDRPGTFRLIVETMNDGLGVESADGRLTYVNARLCEMLGWDPGELLGRRLADLLAPEERERFEAGLRAHWAGVALPQELTLVDSRGSEVSVLHAPKSLFDVQGRFLGAFSLLTDVTARKKDEEARRITQFSIDRTADAAFWIRPDGTFFYVNEAACSSLGYTADELLRMGVPQITPDYQPSVFDQLSHEARNQGSITFETVHVTQAGLRFPVEVTMNYLQFNGREYFCAFARDITERKRSERALRESEERYRTLFDGVPVGLYRSTPSGQLLEVNLTLLRILAAPDRETLLRTNAADLYVDPEDRRHWQESLGRGDDAQAFEARVRRLDGTVVWVRFSVQGIRDAAGQILYYEGAMEDVTGRRRAEEALRASEERFRSLVQNASDMISILEPDGVVRYESPSHQRVLGRGPEGSVGRSVFDQVHPDDRGRFAEALQDLVDLPGDIVTIEYRCRHQDGSWRFLESTGANLLGQPAVAGIVLNSHDITDRKRAEERLLHDALHDELTGLPNRALFMDRLRQSMERSHREPERLTVVLFLDVDRFKIVNDSLGHLVGDELLVRIAAALSGALRPCDTIARVGGDEFAVLVEAARDVADAVRVADRIHDRLTAPIHLHGHEVVITTSIGIAVCSDEYEKPEDLLRDADIAMYRAKSSGRSCHVVFNRGMHRSMMDRLQIEADLRRAVERGQLQVYYQPFVELTSGEVVGFEALLRWQHPQRGFLAPDEFLSVAEETGLIVPMGRRVLLEACAWARRLQDRLSRRLRLSVNLSNNQFFDPGLFDLVDEALASSGLEPACLGLEITEGVILPHAESASARFARLKERGVQLYMDDFG